VPAPWVASTEADMVAAAKAAMRGRLRIPQSGKFGSVSVKVADDNTKAVCGTVDSRNDTDGMTGPIPFVYDGTKTYLLVSSGGADNGTIYDGTYLTQGYESASAIHDKFCR